MPTWTRPMVLPLCICRQEASIHFYLGEPLAEEVKCVHKLLTGVPTSLEFWVDMARVGLPGGTLPISASRVAVTGTLASPVAVADNT